MANLYTDSTIGDIVKVENNAGEYYEMMIIYKKAPDEVWLLDKVGRGEWDWDNRQVKCNNFKDSLIKSVRDKVTETRLLERDEFNGTGKISFFVISAIKDLVGDSYWWTNTEYNEVGAYAFSKYGGTKTHSKDKTYEIHSLIILNGSEDIPGITLPPAVIYIDIPASVGDSFKYNGKPQKPELTYDEKNVTVVLPSDYTNVGRYMGIFRLKDKDKTQWSSGGIDDISFIWEITGTPIATGEITQKGTLTYNGKEQTPKWNNYDPDKMTIGGTTSAISRGDYIATFTPKPGYTWSDGTAWVKEVKWKINPMRIPIPTLCTTSFEYDGKPHEPEIDYHGYEDYITTTRNY